VALLSEAIPWIAERSSDATLRNFGGRLRATRIANKATSPTAPRITIVPYRPFRADESSDTPDLTLGRMIIHGFWLARAYSNPGKSVTIFRFVASHSCRRFGCLPEFYSRVNSQARLGVKVTPTGISNFCNRPAHSPRQLFIFLLVICSLSFSLATRTFRLHAHQSATIKSNVPHATRQHLDRDAPRWVAPFREAHLLHDLALTAELHDSTPVCPASVFTECLYNRPPPTF